MNWVSPGATKGDVYRMVLESGGGQAERSVEHETGEKEGSTSKVANFDGLSVHSRQLYKPWGQSRYAAGTLPTTYKFTGQREESYINLYWYNSRFYDPALGRFVQADSIVLGDVLFSLLVKRGSRQ